MKGRHVVRQWLKPTNKKSTVQGYLRGALKAISKWIAKVDNVNSGDAMDSLIYQAGTSNAPAGMNWNAYLMQGFLKDLQVAGTFKTTALLAHISDYSTNLDTDAMTAFQTNATALGMADFAFEYGYTTNQEAGLLLYYGALACYKNEIITTAPYNTNPVSWVASDVDDFLEDMTSNA